MPAPVLDPADKLLLLSSFALNFGRRFRIVHPRQPAIMGCTDSYEVSSLLDQHFRNKYGRNPADLYYQIKEMVDVDKPQ